MEEKHTLSKEKERKLFWQSFWQASCASYAGIGTFFGGVIVAPVFLYQFGVSLIYSVFVGVLFYVSFQFYYFPKIYSRNYSASIEKFYRSEILSVRHYAKSHAYLSAAFAIIHKMNRINDLTFEMAVAELGKFCTLIKEFFEEKNNSNCACCIKILIKTDNLEQGDFRVITLCRDSKSDADREPSNVKRIHTVKNNTCFLHFFENINSYDGKFFFSNNLPNFQGYQNSSIAYYQNSTQEHWKLPYKSEIELPLIAKIPDENTHVLGFFCVDSEVIENFNSEFDPEMLIGVADGLYNTLYNQVNEKYGIASKE